jgi:hypothetical protein
MLSPENIRANISREFNVFQDEIHGFLDCFRDDPLYFRIAVAIVNTLTHKLHTVSPFHRRHPFMLYGHPDASDRALIHILHQNIRSKFENENRSYRSLVVSFFHTSGTNRTELNELMQAFWEFQDTCTGAEDAEEDAANPNVSR